MQQNAEHYRKLELERQAHSQNTQAFLASLTSSQRQTALESEDTKHSFQEAEHFDMLLSANLETSSSYNDSMSTFQCLMAELGEKPHTGHMNVAHALAVKAMKDTPW